MIRMAFDFISPYAYLGWHRAQRTLVAEGHAVTPVPILFAALLNANATKGPAEIPAKRVYTWKHVVRLAHAQKVPLSPPPAHPFNPLLGLRVVAAIDDPVARATAVTALFAATWGTQRRGITDPEVVTAVLDAAGLAGAALVAQTQSPAIKARVKDNTAQALAQGVFGVPSWIVDDEVFWGQDSLPHVTAYLRGEDPIAHDPEHRAALEQWRALPASAVRPAAKTRG